MQQSDLLQTTTSGGRQLHSNYRTGFETVCQKKVIKALDKELLFYQNITQGKHYQWTADRDLLVKAEAEVPGNFALTVWWLNPRQKYQPRPITGEVIIKLQKLEVKAEEAQNPLILTFYRTPLWTWRHVQIIEGVFSI